MVVPLIAVILNELTVLSNLESHNAELIKDGKNKEEEVKNEVVNIKCNHDKEQVVVPLENILAHIENHLSGGHEHE